MKKNNSYWNDRANLRMASYHKDSDETINKINNAYDKAIKDINEEAMDIVDDNPYMDTYKLIVELMEKVQHESLVHKTIEALGYYFEILPD